MLPKAGNGAREDLRLGEDQPRGGTQDHVTAFSQTQVAQSVTFLRLPPTVMSATVAFDDDPVIDQEVNSPDSVDLYLNSNVETVPTQKKAGNCFGTRLCASIDEGAKHLISSREALEHLRKIIRIDRPGEQGAVECRDRGARRLTTNRRRESLDDRDRVKAARGARAPVDDDPLRTRQSSSAGMGRPQPRTPRLDLDVQTVRVENEDARFSDGGNAVESTADTLRCPNGLRRCAIEVDVPTGAHQHPLGQRRAHLGPGRPRCAQVGVGQRVVGFETRNRR